MTHTYMTAIARTGYATRAIVYFIIGGFAVLAALGAGGGTPDTKGALMKLMDTGFGPVLLSIVAAGLVCYALWRLTQSLADSDGHGTGPKGLAVRGGLLVSAITHALLALWALAAALAFADDGGGGGSGFASWLMQQPYGRWLVMAAGLCIAGAGVAHVLKGARMGYEKWFKAREGKMKLIRPIATTGLIARGIVFLIIGWLFVYAGFAAEPGQAGGLSEALQWIQQQPYGSVLFLVIAVGLVCFGAYSLLEALYRRITVGEAAPQTRFA